MPLIRSNIGIKPESVTQPFQLLAAWMVGLVLVVGELVYGSMHVYEKTWIPPLYAIGALSTILLFLLLIFAMQTYFRDKMLADKYYFAGLKRTFQLRVKEKATSWKDIKKKGN